MSSWDIEKARKLFYDDGLSSAKVGRLMGISRNAVIGRLYRKFGPLALKRSKDRKEWKLHFMAAEAARKRVQPRKPLPPQLARKRVQPRKPLPPQLDTLSNASAPVSLLAAKPHHCRWIVGHDKTGNALFCGLERDNPNSSWCAAHHRIVWARRHVG